MKKIKRGKVNQGAFGIDIKKSKVRPVQSQSDISTKVKAIIVKKSE